MTKTNPDICRHYKLEAQPTIKGTGFLGAFDIPSKTRQFARNDDGSISVFDTEDEAIAAAGEDLIEALNAQGTGHFMEMGYRVISGPELAVRIHELGIDFKTFAMMCGVSLERVVEWLQGLKPVPRTVHLISVLLGLPGAIAATQEHMEKVIYRKDKMKAAQGQRS